MLFCFTLVAFARTIESKYEISPFLYGPDIPLKNLYAKFFSHRDYTMLGEEGEQMSKEDFKKFLLDLNHTAHHEPHRVNRRMLKTFTW